MDLGLSSRTAVVSASTGGLGLAIARALAAERANVVMFGRRGEIARKEAARLPSALGIGADLTDAHAPEQVVEAAMDRFGAVDILVWNSGGPKPGAVLDLTTADLCEAARLLLAPFVRFLQLVLPQMRERGWGRVVAIGSSGVQQPVDNLALSNALRASVAGICKTLANEVALDGVTVNMVLPGRIATSRVSELDAKKAKKLGLTGKEVAAESQAAIPIGRYGRPDEFAGVVTFLCSEIASYVTGTQIRVDGGLIASNH